MFIRSIFALIALLLVSPVFVSQQHAFSPQNARELERVILAELRETNIPGAAVGIVSGDRLIFAKGFGVSNTETEAPVKPDMLFRLGSTTKMFTSAVVVMLAEDGKLGMREPIGKYAKGLNPAVAALTCDQLLSHTGGLNDEAQMYGLHDDTALGETARGLTSELLFATPGKIYSYSNPGYWLAGYVIEAVSGKLYADVMDERLFKPLGMTTTTLRPTTAMTWPLSQGHDTDVGKPKVIRPFADNAGNWPAGSIFSSVNDLSRFVIAFMNGGQLDGKQVFSTELIKELSSAHASIPGSDNKYGYGLNLRNMRGVRVIEHAGSRSGFGSQIRMAPDQRFAVIILVNRTGGALRKAVERASELMLPMLQPVADTELEPQSVNMEEAEMTRYVGTYGTDTNRIELSIRSGKLWFKRSTREGMVTKVADGRFLAAGGGTSAPVEIVLVPGKDGKAEFLHVGGRTYRKM
jgi:CubicO group peptidase (beta-lactamase class C family)